MTEETLKVVKNISDGSVTIAVEKYTELLAKAAEKAPITYNVIQKTKDMAAADNVMWGGVFLGFGVSLAVIGSIIHGIGRAQQRKLV